MTRFLEKTAEYIVSKYGDAVPELCIVLPNRRGGLFLRKYLSAVVGKTIWSPDIYSIEDFMSGLSGFTIIENTRLLFELYEVHREVEGRYAQPFEEFITWGQQLLQDFNEIDSYLADPGELFGFLSEARALSLWNLDQQPLTEFQTNYLHFYNSLFTYYTKLSGRLIPEKQVYAGLLFRLTAGQIQSCLDNIHWSRIIFAGFNALTKAEESIIDFLAASGKAEMIWDADTYYMNDKNQEAGEFMRGWKKKWGSGEFRWIENDLAGQSRNITVTGVPFNIGQARFCGELLSKLAETSDQPEETAVVLMDEQLLIPLLNSLPANITALNITMGMSLKQSPLFGLFDDIFRMHENRERFHRSSANGKIKFYFRDVLRILQHPSIIKLSGTHRFAFDEMSGVIKHGNRIFLSREEIIPVFADLFHQGLTFLDPVFSPFQQPSDVLSCLKSVILQMRDSVIRDINDPQHEHKGKGAAIELEFVYGFSRVIHQVEALLAKYDTVRNLNTLHKLFIHITETTTLPFYGEPLQGIQVMGMLETRTLDFKNLVMLSVNEDMIPGSKTIHSFIPHDIRRAFHLPSYQHKNAVYAYHFYRLLQRSENVNLVYNTEPDELGGGEKSRFIKQVQQELPDASPGIKITDQVLSAPPLPGQEFPPVIVEKKGDIMALIMERAVKGFSPTSLNTYRRCRLQFYFTFIAEFEEQKELEDTIDPQVFGQAVHDVMNRLYQPFVNQPLTPENIDSMIPLIGTLIEKAFERKYMGPDISYGKNLLLVNVANIMVRNFLAGEKKDIEKLEEAGITFSIKLLEKFVGKTVKVQLKDHVAEIALKGFVDRVDILGKKIRIIDYKTGVAEKREMELNEWPDLLNDPEKDKCFQLLMYAYLLDDYFGYDAPLLEAGIISLKRVKAGFLPVIIPGENGNQENAISQYALEKFEDILFRILREIFDPQVPFDQTGNLDICRICPFINLCGR